MAQAYHLRAQTSLEFLEKRVRSPLKLLRLREYMSSAKKLMSQIIRRVRFNETIPHHEKIFSIFEPHTEWISKSKAGVSVELGTQGQPHRGAASIHPSPSGDAQAER